MQITRSELQDAQTAVFKGKLNAAALYAQVLSAARSGHTSVISASMAPGIVFDTAYELTRQCFSTCTVTVEIRGLFTGDPEYMSYAIRVDWDPLQG